MANQSSVLTWKFSWKRNLVGYSPWDHRIRHDWANDWTHMHTGKHTQTHRHTQTHTHAHIYIYICVCIYIYIFPPPRQEYWSGVPFSLPGDLPHPRIKPVSLALADGFFTTAPLGKPHVYVYTPAHTHVYICFFLLPEIDFFLKFSEMVASPSFM